MNKTAVIQARLGSTRLPGKVLKDLAGRPMIERQLARLRRCQLIDEIVLATSLSSSDDDLDRWARSQGLRCIRGSEADVLSRYVLAARASNADIVVRVTADCPLIDPVLTDRVIGGLLEKPGAWDYASNVVERTLPRGLDVEAFFRIALERIHRMAQSGPAREHVTRYLLVEHPEKFRIRSIKERDDHSDLRWCVDTIDDFRMVERLYRDLDLANTIRPYREILSYVRTHPDIPAINSHVEQKAT